MATSLVQVAELRARIDELEKARAAAITGSSYSIGGRTLTRQDLAEIDNEHTRLVRQLKRVESVLEGARDPSAGIASWHR